MQPYTNESGTDESVGHIQLESRCKGTMKSCRDYNDKASEVKEIAWVPKKCEVENDGLRGKERTAKNEVFLNKLRKYMTVEDSDCNVETLHNSRREKQSFVQRDSAGVIRRPVALIPASCNCQKCLEGPQLRVLHEASYECKNNNNNGHCYNVEPKRFNVYKPSSKQLYFGKHYKGSSPESRDRQFSRNEDMHVVPGRVSGEVAARYLIESKMRGNWNCEVAKVKDHGTNDKHSWMDRTTSLDQESSKTNGPYKEMKEKYWDMSVNNEPDIKADIERRNSTRYREFSRDTKKCPANVKEFYDDEGKKVIKKRQETTLIVRSNNCKCPECTQEISRTISNLGHVDYLEVEDIDRLQEPERIVCKIEKDEEILKMKTNHNNKRNNNIGKDKEGKFASSLPLKVDTEEECFPNDQDFNRPRQRRTALDKRHWKLGKGSPIEDEDQFDCIVNSASSTNVRLDRNAYPDEDTANKELTSASDFDEETKCNLVNLQNDMKQPETRDILANSPTFLKIDYENVKSKEKRLMLRQAKEKSIGKKSRALANWLERKRVAELNDAFERLRKMVPAYGNEDRSLSKIKTLRYASTYINHLAVIHEKQCRYGIEDLKQGLMKFMDIDPMLQRCQEHLETQCII